MDVICPKCEIEVPETNISAQGGICLCPNCKEVTNLDDLIPEGFSVETENVNQPLTEYMLYINDKECCTFNFSQMETMIKNREVSPSCYVKTNQMEDWVQINQLPELAEKINACKYCSKYLNGNYCQSCGSPVCLEKIDKQYVIKELRGVIGAETKTFQSFLRLVLRPGECAKEFIEDDRSKYVKPFVYLVFNSLIYAIILRIFGQDFFYDDAAVAWIWILQNTGYFYLIHSFGMAFIIKGTFKEYGYNIYEIYVLVCFLAGTATLFFSILKIISYFVPEIGYFSLPIIGTIWITVPYYVWGIGSFFDKKRVKNYIRAYFCYVLMFVLLVLVLFMFNVFLPPDMFL